MTGAQRRVQTAEGTTIPRRPGKRPALHHVNLPASLLNRWVPSRKEAVVEAVRCGQITFGEACDRFAITADELIGWFALSRSGRNALRVTRRPENKE